MHPPKFPEEIFSEAIGRIRLLFTEMDKDYRRVAGDNGFVCEGCEENCCLSLFYHHTYLEYILLRTGFEKLPIGRRQKIIERAAAYLRTVSADSKLTGSNRPLCPLNEEGRCILYASRPMICRLHGIPHEFAPPGQPLRVGPGCKDFYRQCGQKEGRRLDRTHHYMELARLEARIKNRLGLRQKLKLTVAEMLLREPPGRMSSAAAQPRPDQNHETD